MVRPQGELPSQQIWPKVTYEVHSSKEFLPGDTIVPLCFAQGSAGIGDDSL